MKDLVVYLVVTPTALVAGAIIGFVISRYIFKKQMEKWQKQMETPDKEQIRNMLSALGQKPSEEQVNRFISMTNKKDVKKPKNNNPPKKKK